MTDNYTFEKGINKITKKLDYIIQQNTDHIIQTERLIEEIGKTEEYEIEETEEKKERKPEVTAIKNNNDKITQERR